MGSLGVPDETLLRFVRLIKSGGLKVKTQFAVKINKSDTPSEGDRAYGAYVVPAPRTSGMRIAFLITQVFELLSSHAFEICY